MPILLSFFVLLFSFQSFGKCGFKEEAKGVVSLSGPVTVFLKEVGLLNHPKLLGVSVFNPVGKDFKGKLFPGGVFLSDQVLKDFNGTEVFFDEGRELRKVFSRHREIHGHEIKTRNLLPLEVSELVVTKISGYLSGCESEVKNFLSRGVKIQSELLSLIPKNHTVVFYLGELSARRMPDLIMVNDGIVKLLEKKNKIKTYPSDLAYVNWSTKLMKNMPKDTWHIGLKDSGKEGTSEIKKSSRRMTFIYPGVLVPGYSQLEAFHYLYQNL